MAPKIIARIIVNCPTMPGARVFMCRYLAIFTFVRALANAAIEP
jgi:hypothetical protein